MSQFDFAAHDAYLGDLDLLRYGDLMDDFGGPGAPSDEYFRSLTGASRSQYRAAGHDFRNDAGVRPMKDYSPDVR